MATACLNLKLIETARKKTLFAIWNEPKMAAQKIKSESYSELCERMKKMRAKKNAHEGFRNNRQRRIFYAKLCHFHRLFKCHWYWLSWIFYIHSSHALMPLFRKAIREREAEKKSLLFAANRGRREREYASTFLFADIGAPSKRRKTNNNFISFFGSNEMISIFTLFGSFVWFLCVMFVYFLLPISMRQIQCHCYYLKWNHFRVTERGEDDIFGYIFFCS